MRAFADGRLRHRLFRMAGLSSSAPSQSPAMDGEIKGPAAMTISPAAATMDRWLIQCPLRQVSSWRACSR
jgi:hypothetical protein